ncbi:MAG TPA: cation diffusion facilitator family transporter [Candidatus Limnocylindrales bacterium]
MSDQPGVPVPARAHQHETAAPHGPDHPHDHGPDADHVHSPHEHDVDGGHGHGVDGGAGHALHGHEHPTGRVASLVAAVVGHSHDPADSLDDALAGDRRGIRAVQISLVGLGITAVLQLGIVAISGSVALLADTVHNFSDALTAVPLWIAFAIGGRAATRQYTFGFRRAEDLAGLFVLVMILGSAIFAAWESITRLIDPQPITNIPIVIVAGIIGFLGNEGVALYRIRIGRQIGSAALVADGYHARTDGLTSLAVVAGAIGVAMGFPLADPVVGLLISAVILVLLRTATAQMVGRLMDAVQPEMVDEVERITRETPGVVEVEKVRLRWVGHALETNLSITVDQDLTVMDGHAISEEVRHRLLHQVSKLDTVVIHVNPCDHGGVDPHRVVRHHEAPSRG